MKNNTVYYRILIVLLLFVSNSTICFSQYDYLWERKFGVSGRDEARDLIETKNRNIILVGYTNLKSKRWIWITKINPSGFPVWGKTIEKNGDAVAESVVETEDNSFVITGKVKNDLATDYDMYVVKLDSAGNVVWDKMYGGDFDDGANAIVATTDGGFVIGGYSETEERGDDYRIIKIDSEGNIVWESEYGGSKNERILDVINTDDDGFLHVGYAQAKGMSERSFQVTKLNAEGEIIWEEYFNDEGFERTIASSAVLLHNGNLAIAGYCKKEGNVKYDMKVVCMSADGQTLWDRNFVEANWGEATSIIETYDKRIVLTGFNQYQNGEQSDFWIVKLDSLGNKVWDLVFKRNSLDYANSIIQSYDKGLIVAGSTYAVGSISWDFAVLKFKNIYFPDSLTMALHQPWENHKVTTHNYFDLKGCVQSPYKLKSLEILINDKSWKGNLLENNTIERNDTCDTPINFRIPLKQGKNAVVIKAENDIGKKKMTDSRNLFYIPHLIKDW